jgi:hypothetical protein
MQMNTIRESQPSRLSHGPQFLEQVVDFFEVLLRAQLVVSPELRILALRRVEILRAQLFGHHVDKRLHRHQRVADVMAHACRHEAKADHAVANHHVVQHRHFFTEQLVALTLHAEQMEGVLDGVLQLLRIPRLGEVMVNCPGVDRLHHGFDVRIGRGQNAQDVRLDLPHLIQQPHAFFTGHELIGDEQTNLLGVFL